MQSIKNYNERDLLLLIAEGNEQAFRQLFHHYKEKIYSVALRITRSETRAEELLQDIFMIIWLKRAHLPQLEDFNAYLFIVARNESYRELKKIAKEKKIAGGELSEDILMYEIETDKEISLQDYNALIQKAVAQLPQQQKAVYKLIKEKGLTREQTAQAMHINSETVKSHLAKAMKAIRAYCIAGCRPALIALMFIRNIFL